MRHAISTPRLDFKARTTHSSSNEPRSASFGWPTNDAFSTPSSIAISLAHSSTRARVGDVARSRQTRRYGRAAAHAATARAIAAGVASPSASASDRLVASLRRSAASRS
jgi:hypothetical protein